jgi:hypothetical protein
MSYDAMKSQGSFSEATRQPPSSETLAALDRSHARMAEWIDWAEKTFPELPERANIFASAGMMVKRSGRKPTRENVTRAGPGAVRGRAL